MGNLTTLAKESLLLYLLNGSARIPFNSETELRLMSFNGNADVEGSEISGDSYEPEPLYWNVVGSVASNDDDISFDIIDTTQAVTIVGVEVWSGDADASSVMYRVAYAELSTPVSVSPGDSFVISSNNLEVELV